jgi:hypothetical protein
MPNKFIMLKLKTKYLLNKPTNVCSRNWRSKQDFPTAISPTITVLYLSKNLKAIKIKNLNKF